jgi:hypothetical protein
VDEQVGDGRADGPGEADRAGMCVRDGADLAAAAAVVNAMAECTKHDMAVTREYIASLGEDPDFVISYDGHNPHIAGRTVAEIEVSRVAKIIRIVRALQKVDQEWVDQ